MANLDLSRLRPTRSTVKAAGGLLWAISFGALRDFVWADVRSGLIDLRGLSRATRTLVWFGLLLVGGMVLALLFNDTWRSASPLIVEVNGTPGRGSLLPEALLPVSLFCLSVAWAFLLTGALHAHPVVRVGIILFYMLTMGIRVGTLVTTQIETADFGVPMWLSVLALLAVPIFFLVRRRSQARPIVDFTVLLVLVSTIYVVSQSTGVASWHAFGIPVTLAQMEADILLPGLVIMPLLLFFGVDVANFTRRAAGWVVDIVAQRTASWMLWMVLIAVFALRWRDLLQETLNRLDASSLQSILPAYAGALGVLVIVALVWVWMRGRPSSPQPVPAPAAAEKIHSEAAGGSQGEGRGGGGVEDGVRLEPPEIDEAVVHVALPLIVVYYVASLVSLFAFGHLAMDPGGLLVSTGALVLAFVQRWRGRRNVALYLGVFGGLSIWSELTKAGAPLGALGMRTGNAALVDLWLVAGLTSAGLYWLVRRRLTPERGARLLLLILITALLRQTSFIESPFSPFLAFAGIGFIAFGIVWDVATKGFFINHSTPGLPRISRLFLYLGYMLLTVTMINWALTSHDLSTLGQYTGGVADAGFGRFGKPFLYAIIAATLALPATTSPSRQTAEEELRKEFAA